MTDEAIFECKICGQEFDWQDEAEEHVVYNHDVVRDEIAVHDPANHAEPGGL